MVYHTNKSNAVFELARESEHLRKVLDVVNVRFVRDNHSEYILPGTESQLSINGTHCDLKHYLKKVPNACEQFEILLQEDNAKNAAMVAAIEQQYSSVNNYVTDDSIQKFTSVNMVNIEDGREM